MRYGTSYLTAKDLVEEDEQESDLPENYWARTERSCANCEELLCFNEEIIQIIIVQAQQVPQEGTLFYPVLNDDGDFEYEPLLLHFECYESACDEYHELIADEPKSRSRTPSTDLFRCSFCKDGIGPFQEFGHIVLGEIDISERRNEPTFKETEGGSPEPVCLGCLERIHEQVIELWKS